MGVVKSNTRDLQLHDITHPTVPDVPPGPADDGDEDGGGRGDGCLRHDGHGCVLNKYRKKKIVKKFSFNQR